MVILSLCNCTAEARHDTFLDDPYPSGSRANFQPQQPLSNGATRAVYAANSEDEFDEEEELSGLLARTTVRPAAYLQDWKMTNTQRSQNDAVQVTSSGVFFQSCLGFLGKKLVILLSRRVFVVL